MKLSIIIFIIAITNVVYGQGREMTFQEGTPLFVKAEIGAELYGVVDKPTTIRVFNEKYFDYKKAPFLKRYYFYKAYVNPEQPVWICPDLRVKHDNGKIDIVDIPRQNNIYLYLMIIALLILSVCCAHVYLNLNLKSEAVTTKPSRSKT